MSTNGSTNNVTAIETDMRDVLRERKARLSNVSRETDNDYSSFVSGISVDRFKRSIISLRAFKGCARS
jgi:hypothetical protein